MKLFFRGQRNVHKWLVLFFVLIFSLLSQWSRWLPVYLSSVRIKECVGPGVCKGIIYEPVCKECSEVDEACLLCRACRIEYESEYYNFQDGVCMTRKQYGLITGFGFSLTFSIFGLVAGFFVDVSSERAATILGFSVLLGGIMAVLYSYCTHFDQVLLLRALLGGLQAFGAPASVSMITSHFKRASDRPFANAAYTVGLYLGAGMSSISTIIAEQYGWHAPFRLVGYCGIAVAVIFEVAVDLNVACVSQQKGGTSSSQATAISVPSYGTIKKNEYHPLYSPTGVHMQNRSGMAHATGSGTGSAAGKNEMNRSGIGMGTGAGMGTGKESSRTAPTSDEDFFDEHEHEHEHEHDGMHRLDPDEMHHNHHPHHHHSVHFDENGIIDRVIIEGSDAGDSYVPFFNASTDSNKDDSVVVLPQLAPTIEYTYFSTAGMSDDGFEDESDEDEFMQTYMAQAERQSERVLGSARRPIGHVVYTMFMGDKVPGAMPMLLAASALRFIGGVTIFVYFPVLVARRFPAEESLYSIFNALVVLACGSLSAFLGGRIGQFIVRRYGLVGLARFVAVLCAGCIPPFLMALRTGEFWTSVGMLALGYLVGEAWMGASMALLQGFSPSKGQGLAMSLYLFLNWNASAVITEWIAWVDPGTVEVSRILEFFVVVTLGASFTCFMGLAALLPASDNKLGSSGRGSGRSGRGGAGAGVGGIGSQRGGYKSKNSPLIASAFVSGGGHKVMHMHAESYDTNDSFPGSQPVPTSHKGERGGHMGSGSGMGSLTAVMERDDPKSSSGSVADSFQNVP